jgi:hypothetical protein
MFVCVCSVDIILLLFQQQKCSAKKHEHYSIEKYTLFYSPCSINEQFSKVCGDWGNMWFKVWFGYGHEKPKSFEVAWRYEQFQITDCRWKLLFIAVRAISYIAVQFIYTHTVNSLQKDSWSHNFSLDIFPLSFWSKIFA